MISAIVLTHNSENTIKKTLDSLRWCDELIVIDDYSTDSTREITKKQGAVIYERDLQNDFAAQRNFGLEKANGDWVLFVDSDEIVSDALRKEIQEKISSPSRVVGYYLKRTDFMWNRSLLHGETNKVKLLRLGKKGKGEWQRKVHEYWDLNGPVDNLWTPLFHYPHPTVGEFLTDINRYTSINAQVFLANNVRMKPWQITIYPIAKFIQNYIFRLGFLDGTAGFVHAMMMSFHSFLTRGKMWEIQHRQK